MLDGRWSAWFEGFEVTSDESGQTRIVRRVGDPAALYGLLAKIRDLGLRLFLVRHIDPHR